MSHVGLENGPVPEPASPSVLMAAPRQGPRCKGRAASHDRSKWRRDKFLLHMSPRYRVQKDQGPDNEAVGSGFDDRVHTGEPSRHGSISIESTIAWSSERCFFDVPT